jgi:hypothetical protein
MPLSRKAKVIVAVGVLAAAVAFVGWYGMQPKFRFATRAEVEALMDPELKEPLARNAAAEAR